MSTIAEKVLHLSNGGARDEAGEAFWICEDDFPEIGVAKDTRISMSDMRHFVDVAAANGIRIVKQRVVVQFIGGY